MARPDFILNSLPPIYPPFYFSPQGHSPEGCPMCAKTHQPFVIVTQPQIDQPRPQPQPEQRGSWLGTAAKVGAFLGLSALVGYTAFWAGYRQGAWAASEVCGEGVQNLFSRAKDAAQNASSSLLQLPASVGGGGIVQAASNWLSTTKERVVATMFSGSTPSKGEIASEVYIETLNRGSVFNPFEGVSETVSDAMWYGKLGVLSVSALVCVTLWNTLSPRN